MTTRPAFVVAIILSQIVAAATLRAQQFASTFAPAPWAAALTDVKFADINQNGVADLFCLTETAPGVPGAISLLADQGTTPLGATLPPAVLLSASLPAQRIAWFEVGDFDGNGMDDILFAAGNASYGPSTVYLSAGLGGGIFSNTFVAISGPTVGNRPAFGDFNGDGVRDVAISVGTTGGAANLELRFGGPALGVAAFTRTGPPFQGGALAGDFNGDGIDDLGWNVGTGGSEVLLGVVGGTFGAPIAQTSTAFSAVFPQTSGDFDGDGRDDVFVGFPVPWHRGTASGALSPQAPSVLTWPVWIESNLSRGDIDADGIDDCIYGVQNGNAFNIVIPRRAVGGTPMNFVAMPLTSWVNPPTSTGAAPVFFGDLDGDGDTDMLCVERNGLSSGIQTVENRARYGVGCPGSLGVPQITNSAPVVGPPPLSVGLANARPGSAAFLVLSFFPTPIAGCGILVSTAPADLILLNGQMPVALVSPAGTATIVGGSSIAAPLVGFSFAAQWAVLDPLGTFAVGATSLALSPGRVMTIR